MRCVGLLSMHPELDSCSVEKAEDLRRETGAKVSLNRRFVA